MARIETWFDQDLKNPVPVRVLTGSAFSLDNLGNLIGVKVTDGGEIITLAGSVTGYCMLADGQTVTVAGTRSGNMASIVLPQTAYTVPGPIRISIKLTEGSAITTLLACVGTVVRTQTGNIVNPGSVVQDWSTQISAQLQACQDAADNMGAMVAVAFNPSSVYAAGNYVTYNGGLYRITAAHEAGTTWANTSKTQVTVGAELSDLNRAFGYVYLTQKPDGYRVLQYRNGTWKNARTSNFPYYDNSANRICPNGFIRVFAGDAIEIKNGSGFKHGYCIWYGELGNLTFVKDTSSWVEDDETLYMEKDGVMAVTFADKQDASASINPSIFDGSIVVKRKDDLTQNLNILADLFSESSQTQILEPLYAKGWIGNQGAIQSVTSEENPEMYTVDYIPVKTGDVIRFSIKSNTAYKQWVSVVAYDENKIYIGRTTVYELNNVDKASGEWISTRKAYAFVRFCYRSSVNGYVNFMAAKCYRKYSRNKEIESYNNKYINTNVSIGASVNLEAKTVYQNWILKIYECFDGDQFIVSGLGGGTGRLWAFVDEDDKLLSKSAANAFAVAEEITAPDKARKLIYQSSTYADNAVGFGKSEVPQNILARSIIDEPYIIDPENLIVKPEVAYHNQNIQQDQNTVCTKFGIFKSGNNFCITFAENVDHSNQDNPDMSESGKMVYKYKYFHFDGSTESDVSYGIVAKKGSQYIDINGNSEEFIGGISFGSSVNNRLFFSAAYTNANINSKDYKPCTCSVTLTDSGVIFGEIHELILIVDGVPGEFNTERFGSWEFSYYTSSQPYFDDGYKWFISTADGFAYLTSTDGITWTCINKLKTPYYTYKEVSACKLNDDLMLFAARTNDYNYTRDGIYTFIGLYNIAKNEIVQQYRVPSGVAKPLIVKCGNSDSDNILVITDPTFKHSTYYRVIYYNTLELVKWFEIYGDATYYANILQDTIANHNFTEMYIVGNNGRIQNHSSAFIKLTFNTDDTRDIRYIPFTVK